MAEVLRGLRVTRYFNFGAVGSSTTVAEAEAKAMDRRRSREISLGAFAIGVVVGVVAALLPV